MGSLPRCVCGAPFKLHCSYRRERGHAISDGPLNRLLMVDSSETAAELVLQMGLRIGNCATTVI